MFPNINIYLDTCNTCNRSVILPRDAGGCSCSSPVVITPVPNDPCHNCPDTCVDATMSSCVLYDASDIPGLGIVKYDKLTKTLITMAAEIIDLKRRLLASNIPV